MDKLQEGFGAQEPVHSHRTVMGSERPRASSWLNPPGKGKPDLNEKKKKMGSSVEHEKHFLVKWKLYFKITSCGGKAAIYEPLLISLQMPEKEKKKSSPRVSLNKNFPLNQHTYTWANKLI